MQLNSNQTKTELRLARFPAISNNIRIYSAGFCPGPLTGACVYGLSGQQKGKGRKEVWLWTFQGSVCLFWYFLSVSRCPTPVKKNIFCYMLQSCSIFRENRSKGSQELKRRERGNKKSPFGWAAADDLGFSSTKGGRRMTGSLHSFPPFPNMVSVNAKDSCPSQIWYASDYSHTSSNPSRRSQPPA